MEDDAIRTLLKRLSRPGGAGVVVIERAAIMAEGPQSGSILEWILAHGGQAEAALAPTALRGVHSTRQSDSGGIGTSPPRRYVLPASELE